MGRPLYFMLRVANLAIKPMALLVAGRMGFVEEASALSAMYGVSAITMTSMSFGAYKWFLPIEHRASRGSLYLTAFSVYRGVVLLGVLLAILVGYVTGAFLFHAPDMSLVLMALVCAEFIVHEDGRRKLYAGRLVHWAAEMLLSNVVFLSALAIFAVAEKYEIAPAGMSLPVAACAMLVFALVNSMREGVLELDRGKWWPSTHGLRMVVRRTVKFSSYTISSMASRSVQQGDRILFYALMPANAWIYSIVAYAATVPLVLFEMNSMAVFKAKVLGNRRSRSNMGFQLLSRKDVEIFILISSAATIGLLGSHLLGVLRIPGLIWLIFAQMCLINFLQALVMKNSEQVFWAASSPRSYFQIEAVSFLVLAAASFMVLYVVELPLFIKVPAAMALLAKLMMSRVFLQRRGVR